MFLARRVAQLSRHLPADRIGVVDSRRRAGDRPRGRRRVLAVAEAKVIEADPSLHDERSRLKARRYVGSSRTDEYGLRTVIARIAAGDAVWVEATVQRAPRSSPRATPPGARGASRYRLGTSPGPRSSSLLLLEHTDAPAPGSSSTSTR